MNTETPITELPAAKPKRKRKARKSPRRASFQKPAQPKGELAGLTETACATDCKVGRCVISGQGYCAHPRKGGLQGVDMHSTGAIGRLNEARKMLATTAVDKRFA